MEARARPRHRVLKDAARGEIKRAIRQQDLAGAAAAFRTLAASRDSAVRAGALLRLARVERKADQLGRALESGR